MREFYMKVVGVTFENRQRVIRKLQPGQQLNFVPDPHNPYDNHAVQVQTQEGIQIGFISKDQNKDIFENITNGRGTYEVNVSNVTGGGANSYGCNIKVRYNLR